MQTFFTYLKKFSLIMILSLLGFVIAPTKVQAWDTCGSAGFMIAPEYYEVQSGASSHIISLFSDNALEGEYQIRIFRGTTPNVLGQGEIAHTEWVTATQVNGKNVLNMTITDADALTSDTVNGLTMYLYKNRVGNPWDIEICTPGYYVIVPEGQTAPPEPTNPATPHYTVQPEPVEPETPEVVTPPQNPPGTTVSCTGRLFNPSQNSCACTHTLQSIGGQTCCGWVNGTECTGTPSLLSAPSPSPDAALPGSSVICGNWFDSSTQTCSCSGSPQETAGSQTCCGWVNGIRCESTAPDPSPARVCGVISGANCIIDGTSHSWGNFQLCPNNTVSCCFETAQCPASDGTGCGTWQGAQCVTSDGRIVTGAISCSTDSTQCCSAASLCPAEPPGTSPPPAGPGGPGPGDPPSTDPIDITSGPKPSDFEMLNPLRMGDNPSPYADQLSSPGGVVSRMIIFAFPLAGLLLFVMLVWGGFEMLSRGATQKSMDAGRQRVTAALIGFMLLFVSFWIMRIIEVIFGVAVI